MVKRAAVVTFLAVVFNQVVAQAGQEAIKQCDYSYSYDDLARNMDGDVFVVCSDSPNSKLNPIYSFPIRFSQKAISEGQESAPTIIHNERVTTLSQPKSSLLEIINFKFNSAVLSDNAKEQLDVIASTSRPVKVKGYTCSIGPEEYNQKLSLKRAHAVSHYLVRKGASIYELKGLGESTEFKSKQKNRRVEIYNQGESGQ